MIVSYSTDDEEDSEANSKAGGPFLPATYSDGVGDDSPMSFDFGYRRRRLKLSALRGCLNGNRLVLYNSDIKDFVAATRD